MTIVFIIQIICSSSFYFVVNNKVLTYIIVILISSIAGVSFSLIPASVYKKYGIKYGSQVYSVVFIAFGIASTIGPSLSSIFYKSNSINTISYLVIYEFGVFTAIIGLILVYNINTTQV